MEKVENEIRIPNDDYNEMQRRELDYGKKFKEKIRNPREYLFDRLIEYVGMDILEYEIQKNIEKRAKNTESFTIYKTDPLDDSSAGADYVVLYKFRGEKRERIVPIDLFVSDKTLKIEGEEKEGEQKKIQPGSLEEKLEKAKEPKTPYSTYIKLF